MRKTTVLWIIVVSCCVGLYRKKREWRLRHSFEWIYADRCIAVVRRSLSVMIAPLAHGFFPTPTWYVNRIYFKGLLFFIVR